MNVEWRNGNVEWRNAEWRDVAYPVDAGGEDAAGQSVLHLIVPPDGLIKILQQHIT